MTALLMTFLLLNKGLCLIGVIRLDIVLLDCLENGSLSLFNLLWIF